MLPDTIRISELHNAAPTTCSCLDCSCLDCKSMCHKSPCLGTPNDILTIANNGFAEHLTYTTWAVGKIYLGLPVIEMIQLHYDEDKKQCSLLDDNGLCRLHDLGIKPTEGVLSDTHGTNKNVGANMVKHIALEWLNPANVRTMHLLDILMEKIK